jgi:DNA-binding NtrC family response regulator
MQAGRVILWPMIGDHEGHMDNNSCAVSNAKLLADRPAGLSGVRVFVAEDEQMLLWVLEEVLAEFGCETIGTATHVADSLAFVKDNVFDVAILDVTLVDGDTQPVANLLNARGTPFIITSGKSHLEAPTVLKNALYLQKPYTCDDLKKMLLAALA